MGALIMVGDRVLVAPDEGERKTNSGLVLPASVSEQERVHSGRVVSTGPGYITPNPEFTEGEPWSRNREAVRYLPLQAQTGDHAFFLRKEAIEVEFEGDTFLIVPHSAILALHRSDADDILGSISPPDDLDNDQAAANR